MATNYKPSEEKMAADLVELAAWEEWKEKCAVRLCSPDHVEALDKKIRSAFMAKLGHFRGALDHDGAQYDFGEIDCSTEFDSALLEYENCNLPGHEIYYRGAHGDETKVRKAKCWKDFTWQCAAKSSDPRLQVIRGKLVGGVSVMHAIVEDYISRNLPGRFCNGKYVIDKPIVQSGDESGTSEEAMFKQFHPDADLTLSSSPAVKAAPAEASSWRDDDFAVFLEEFPIDLKTLDKWRIALESAFDVRTCCVLLAATYQIKLYREEEMMAALGIKKQACYDALERAQESFKSLPKDFREEVISSFEVKKFFLEWLQKRVETEKCAQPILSRVKEIKTGK